MRLYALAVTLVVGACGAEPDQFWVAPYYAYARVDDVPGLNHTTEGMTVGLAWDLGRRARAQDAELVLADQLRGQFDRVIDKMHDPPSLVLAAAPAVAPPTPNGGVTGFGTAGDVGTGTAVLALLVAAAKFLHSKRVKRKHAAKQVPLQPPSLS